MKVLVIGASGFIGFPIAQALSRAGHIVYGLIRSQEKAKLLATEEIIPVVGEASKPEGWLHIVSALDVVIEALGGTAPLATLSNEVLEAITEHVKANRDPIAPKLSYIYTTGTWVHGDNREETVTDTSQVKRNVEIVAWRPAQEHRVVTHPVLNGIVVRPALLYGRSGSLFEPAFKSASEGKVVYVGTPGGRLTLVHPDDLADLYVLVAEKAQLVGGKIFDAANDFTESIDDFLAKLVRVSGAQGPYQYREPTNLFEVGVTTTTLLRPYLARALLGWRPKKMGLVDGLPLYYAAWLASVEGPGFQKKTGGVVSGL